MIPIYEPTWNWRYTLAVLRQIQSGWIGPGKKVEEFASVVGAQFGRFCTITNSGTSALMLAYLAAKLPVGATICCPDYGLPACQNAAWLLGYKVALIDILPSTGCMDPLSLERYLSSNEASCVVFVNHNGYSGPDLQSVARIAESLNLVLIEDSAVALGCRNVGTTGLISTLSFSVPKIITTGQGGAVLTADPDVAERLRQLVDQGGGNWRQDRLHSAVGGNFRMPDLLAAIGVAQMKELPRLLGQRDRVWGWYRARLPLAHDVRPSGWLITYLAADEDRANSIIERLQKRGFDCKRLYRPVHHNLPYSAPPNDDSWYPSSSYLYKKLLYLPSSPKLTREQVDAICSVVLENA